ADRLGVLYNLHRTNRELIDITTVGLHAAMSDGDRHGQARLLYRRGYAFKTGGDAKAALEDLERARTLCAELGDTDAVARVMLVIGLVSVDVLGEYDEALSKFV